MSAFAHICHLIMTVLFFPWIIVWVGCAVSAGNSRKRKEAAMREEEIALLRELVRKNK